MPQIFVQKLGASGILGHWWLISFDGNQSTHMPQIFVQKLGANGILGHWW